MKTVKIASLVLAAAFIFAGCGGKTKKQEGEAAAKERTTEYVITYEGVGPVNFMPGAELPALKGYVATLDDTGKLTVNAEDGDMVMIREWETITVYGPEFKTEEGVHVGMTLGEAIPLMLQGETLVVYGVANDEITVGRRFTSGNVVEEDDSISYWVDGSAVKEGSRAKLQADPRATADDLDPEAKITKISVTQLL